MWRWCGSNIICLQSPHITCAAQGPIIVAPNNYLRRFRGDPVRENRRCTISTFRAKRRQLFHSVAEWYQIQNRAKSLSPEVSVQAAHIHMFPMSIYHHMNRWHQIREKLPFINEDHVGINDRIHISSFHQRVRENTRNLDAVMRRQHRRTISAVQWIIHHDNTFPNVCVGTIPLNKARGFPREHGAQDDFQISGDWWEWRGHINIYPGLFLYRFTIIYYRRHPVARIWQNSRLNGWWSIPYCG